MPKGLRGLDRGQTVIGQTVSHYTILEKVGEGGMGIVYKARDLTLNRVVALKFLPHYFTGAPADKQRFYHEARAAAALTHPNIAVIYEIGEADEQLFIAMEFVEGLTLRDVIAKQLESLPVDKVLDIAVQIGQGLEAAHERGIVHRDIKSDNIMLTPKGMVKIMDFGLAAVQGVSRVTQAGSTVGTAAYMSPEQARGEEVDSRSDIFSFGVVLYELLTAHRPFRGEHREALLYSLVNEDPEPIARFNDRVSDQFGRIVLKALAKSKEERYHHAEDMLADLRRERKELEYGQARGAEKPLRRGPGSTFRPKPRGRAWRIILPLATAAILALVLVLISPFTTPPSKAAVNSLAVMYFQDIPDPEDKAHTGEMLTSLLITSLSQLNGLEVISRERLLDVQNDLGHGEGKALSPALAVQVARRAGVTTMLTGSILEQSPHLAVTANLVDVQTGRIISSHKARASGNDQIFNLVDSLSALLRNNLQGSVASQTEVKSVVDVTTKSLEAYHAYVEGLELHDRYYRKEACAAFERAIEIDRNFAMAYYYLAVDRRNLGQIDRCLESLRNAVALSQNVTDRERLQILATNYQMHSDMPKTIETLRQLIERFPHEILPHQQLGVIYQLQLMKPEESVQVFRQGLQVESTAKSLWNELAYSYALLGKKAEALDAVGQYLTLAPAEPNPYDTKGDVFTWFEEYDSSCVMYKKALSLRSDYPSAYKLGFFALLRQNYDEAQRYLDIAQFRLPVVEAYHGHLRRAARLVQVLPDSQLNLTFNQEDARSVTLLNLLYETGQYGDLVRHAQQLGDKLKRNPADRVYRRDYVAWGLIKEGKREEAFQILGDVQNDVKSLSPDLQGHVDYLSALLFYEEGKYALALEQFKAFEQVFPIHHEPNLFYAVTLLRTEHPTEAVSELQRILYWPGYSDDFYFLGALPGTALDWPIPAVKAHYWLGVAYEKIGEREKALEEYRKFTEIWKDADFASPELTDARTRLAVFNHR